MKKFVYLFTFLILQQIGFSQEKLKNGIYVIDQSEDKHIAEKPGRNSIKFNPFFIDGDPEEYSSLVIFTNDYVPLEQAEMPVVQYRGSGENEVLVHLTESAAGKLKEFTARNMMNHIVVVVDGQAVAVYKVIAPIGNTLIRITKCSGSGCNQIFRQLKSTFKP
jgi:hypothetical protein